MNKQIRLFVILAAGVVLTATTSQLGLGGSESGATSTELTTPTAPPQNQNDLMAKFKERILAPEVRARIQATVAGFEETSPRLVKAVRKGKIDFKTYLYLRQTGKEDAADLLYKFEGYKISAAKVNSKVIRKIKEQGDIRIQSCDSDCEVWTDFYVMGCRAGGGDTFTCFVEGECFLCNCRSGCPDPIIIICSCLLQ